MRVLLVEDDQMVGAAVVLALQDAAYAVDWVRDGVTAEENIRFGGYQVILLDLGLPEREGLAVLQGLRRSGNTISVIILTARDGVQDRIDGLDAGADDYLVKPFAVSELLARIRAVVRRQGGQAASILSNGVVSLNLATHEATCGDTAIFLSAREFALLHSLLLHPGQIFSRAELEAWLKIAAGGIQSGVLIIQATDPTQIIRVTNKDGSTVDIDVSALKDIKIERGEIVNGQIIRLHRSDGKQIDIDASTLVPNSPYIVSGVFVERNGGYWLDFTRNDGTHVNVDMTDIINKIIQTVFEMVMRIGYRINTQAEDYTLVGDDFNGRTIVRADKAGDQTITIPKPTSEDFVGKAIIVRKTNGTAGTFVNLVSGSAVSLLPKDATPVRRVGSSVTLVYVGNGVYDVFGELP